MVSWPVHFRIKRIVFAVVNAFVELRKAMANRCTTKPGVCARGAHETKRVAEPAPAGVAMQRSCKTKTALCLM